ncbi:MAG: TerB family tellurite resistance protein [Desulfobacterales bacterium]|nr:TerB family tellurite resistance protein [Desulfobacterales bacterium]
MIDLLKKIFDKSKESNDIDQQDTSFHDIRVATCALLVEMSNIDGEFSESERDSIISILKKDFDLSDEHASELLQSSNEELAGSVDLWPFTNLINQKFSLDEKLRVIETVWKVAYADGKLDKHEDYLVHKLANLLRLSHRQLIDAKLKVTTS